MTTYRIPAPGAASSASSRSPYLARSIDVASNMSSLKPLQGISGPADQTHIRMDDVARSDMPRVVSMPCPRPAQPPALRSAPLSQSRSGCRNSSVRHSDPRSADQNTSPSKDIARRPRVVKRPSSEAAFPMTRRASAQRKAGPISAGYAITTGIPTAKASSSKLRSITKQVNIKNPPLMVSTPRLHTSTTNAGIKAQRARDIHPSHIPDAGVEQDLLSKNPMPWTDIPVAAGDGSLDPNPSFSEPADPVQIETSMTLSDDSITLSRTGSSESLSRANHIYDRHRRTRGSQDSLSGKSASISSSGVSFFTDSSIAKAKLEMVRKASILRPVTAAPRVDILQRPPPSRRTPSLHPHVLSVLQALRVSGTALQERDLLAHSLDREPSSPAMIRERPCWTDGPPIRLYLGNGTNASIFNPSRRSLTNKLTEAESYQDELDFLDEWEAGEQFLSSLGLEEAEQDVKRSVKNTSASGAKVSVAELGRLSGTEMSAVANVNAAWAWMSAEGQM